MKKVIIDEICVRRGGGSHSARTPPNRANKKTKNLRAMSLCFAPVLWPPSDLEVCGRKKDRRRRRKKKNNTKFSGHYVRPRTHNVRAHALRSHQQCKKVQLKETRYNPLQPNATEHKDYHETTSLRSVMSSF